MTCGATVIELAGGPTRYMVDISNPDGPVVRGTPSATNLSGKAAA
jgi:hypothetical protein